MRDQSFSICKAIAIILVVLSHASCPGWLMNFVFMFHVPIFFICAGYFFHTKYLENEKTFVVRRLKGLYLPFLKWSIAFLVLHNLFFATGILNEQYGNGTGGVLHPYTWHAFCQRLWSIVFNMSGYDEFLCGAFWFFRAFLLANVAYLVLFKLFRKISIFKSDRQAVWGILIAMLLLAAWQVLGGLSVTGVAQGGYREIMGVFLISAGYLFREYRQAFPSGWKVSAGCLAFLALAAAYFPSSMSYKATFSQFISFPLPALAGFLLVYNLSAALASRGGIVKRGLVYIGDNTLYVFAFHIVAFKLASAIKVMAYGLPWQVVGCHPAIPRFGEWDCFFLLYTVVGVAVPLLCRAGYLWLSRHYDLSLGMCLMFLFEILLKLLYWFFFGIKCLIIAIAKSVNGFIGGIKGILDASNPKDE